MLKILKYLQRKRKQRLFEQWVERADLPLEEVPPDLLDEQSAEDSDLAPGHISREKAREYTTPIDEDRGIIRLPIRYVLIGLSIIALLLVIVSVLLTVLIIRS